MTENVPRRCLPARCRATVVAVDTEAVFDRTVFYPEGGGQPGDRGAACRPRRLGGGRYVQDAAGRLWHRSPDTPLPRSVRWSPPRSTGTGATDTCAPIPARTSCALLPYPVTGARSPPTRAGSISTWPRASTRKRWNGNSMHWSVTTQWATAGSRMPAGANPDLVHAVSQTAARSGPGAAGRSGRRGRPAMRGHPCRADGRDRPRTHWQGREERTAESSHIPPPRLTRAALTPPARVPPRATGTRRRGCDRGANARRRRRVRDARSHRCARAAAHGPGAGRDRRWPSRPDARDGT